jgi:2-phospho-L-lactate guanylyltransferase
MNHWICVPVKPFEYGKSRLAELLSEEERIKLNRALLEHILATIQQTHWKENKIVISKGTEALEIARNYGFFTITENPPYGLNRSIRKVLNSPFLKSATSITIIPSDLVLVTKEELNELFTLRNEQDGLIIVPDRRKEGTNVLSVMPPDAISFQYGKYSFQKHINSAKSASVHVTVHESDWLGIDLDTESDLFDILTICPNIIDTIPELACFHSVIQTKGV